MSNECETWVVAVSGGADSMALLDMYRNKNYQLVVAHVNYHKRDTANRDENGVCLYCKQYDIPFFAYHVKEYNPGNFQAQARNIRYQFFKEIVKQTNAKGVLVAHHQDDVLETYLMQKQRKSIPRVYGMDTDSTIKGVHVLRPLLNYSKQDLYDYCKMHNIVYYEDESNASNAYTRNRIRHEQVMKLDPMQRKTLLEEMKHANHALQKMRQKLESHVQKELDMQVFATLNQEEQHQLLYMWLTTYSAYHQISKRYIDQLLSLHKKQRNWRHDYKRNYEIVCEYGVLKLQKKASDTYAYTYHEVQEDITPYFQLCTQGKTIEGFYVDKQDFPIVIRSPKSGDSIQLRYGKKKVSRFFIDRKIPKKEREICPVVENANGDVIFVSGIGCDVFHYSNNLNMFVIK
ncbi:MULTISPECIES: tRNA lysidine(34) synthetase TilS [unclassified Breznakia]|uniref:tRNA lysidine(34) synthetase TilS n=1 Tax=unclassified Breznakia TaxID=2623764 RepID=UPI00247382D5|nr:MULTISPECIES: tRNA lysidine(34) synthetase TilS [unclassified Breznakia]MDH6366978.1 tRNA(Ile)-lysidine synthetase-like protein [Breznakia sp. PH1-1]MDH6404250.1 tRNA(Ile)-lysidine synthetase-like protein [Breznakia sp. PF1-11]MDH6411865.1 tRNA(Ile)-lysidine synthetase-like protein [Breznakia sp. PFB1-11]MDH6414238.1 tRNA(Ile)-lysidine synthetase-like protein [Breznakia sp. PFB1-14]MDH6415938.1 tRNA(Ile)-lysidine synthetase-like protein [Breznakia sp. PFB1-4]